MTITIRERPESREWTKGERGRLIYLLLGTEDRDAAMSALEAFAPTTSADGLIREAVDVVPMGDGTSWVGMAPFRKLGSAQVSRDPLDVGEDSGYEFEIGGDSWQIKHSLETVKAYTTIQQTQAIDFGGALNVSRDADGGFHVAGVTLGSTEGALIFGFSKCYALDKITNSYVDALAALCWTWNIATYMGKAAGEVLFTGARGLRRGDGKWEITKRFAQLRNKAAMSVGGVAWYDPDTEEEAAITKLGWDYLWVYYQTKVDSGPPERLVTYPTFAYVEQVYDSGDFSTLEPT